MALKRNERYPGRFENPSAENPQGAFKNMTAPNAKDGAYLERDWANDLFALHSALLLNAGITPNGQVDNALNSQYFDAAKLLFMVPVGVPLPWPGAIAPPGYFSCNGAMFDTLQNRALFEVYPTGRLPDLRGEFIRGLDSGRGVDFGRTVLSHQGDAIRNIIGNIDAVVDFETPSGAFEHGNYGQGKQMIDAATYGYHALVFNAGTVVPVAEENRPRNVAFLYIVRAA